MNLTPDQAAFRAELWRKFVAKYHVVLATHPECLSDYCAKFCELWVAGSEDSYWPIITPEQTVMPVGPRVELLLGPLCSALLQGYRSRLQ